MYQRALMVIRC